MTDLEKYKNHLLTNSFSLGFYNRIKVIYPHLVNNEITQEQFDSFCRERKISGVTANNYRVALINFQRFKNIKISILKKHSIKTEKINDEVLTENDLQDIISRVYINSEKLSFLKFKTVLYLLFYCGVRKMELVNNFKKENFNFNTNEWKIIDGKGKKDRIVFLLPQIKNLVIQFFNTEKTAITKGQINYIMQKIKSKTQKHIYCHLFRHSMAHYLNNKGLSLPSIAKILGHSSTVMTEKYLRLSENEVKREFVEKIVNGSNLNCSIGKNV